MPLKIAFVEILLGEICVTETEILEVNRFAKSESVHDGASTWCAELENEVWRILVNRN
jgi:hypothetical protein